MGKFLNKKSREIIEKLNKRYADRNEKKRKK